MMSLLQVELCDGDTVLLFATFSSFKSDDEPRS